MFLESLYQDAARRRSSFVDRLKAGGEVSPATALAPSHSGANLNQALGYNPTLASHGRQYEHGNTGWPFACIRIIAQRIAGQEIKVGRWVGKPQQGRERQGVKRPHLERLPRTLKDLREDLEVIDNHPLLEAINDPNALMVRWALLFVTVASLEITGKAYWWFFNERRDRTGKWSILPVPASWITPRHAEGKLYAEWEIRSDQNARPVIVPGDEVAYIYYPDPASPLSALSPLQAQAKAVVADEAMTEAQRRAFSQGLWPGVAITMGRNPGVGGQQGNRPVLTEHQRAQIINAVKQAYQGVLRNEEPIILDGWIEAVNRISNSPREMDFTRSGQYTKERITQGFGVNPVILGQLEGANRASATAAEDNFANNTINPKIELISQCLTAWAGPIFAAPGERLYVWIEPAQVIDPDLQMSRLKVMMGYGAVTVNEVRAEMGWSPVPGGDVAYVPNTVTAVDLAKKRDLNAEPAPANSPAQDDGTGQSGEAGIPVPDPQAA
jgi:HK97 family phage portal protein